ncbi:MAG TPA: ATP-binding protein [Nitrospirota bacterium]|nr:ATP-binding protein [Nitrospirota bacterium]
MKIGITYRLFLSILAATGLAILSLFLIMQWSINRGFYQYLKTLDQNRLEQMASNLEEAYAEHGNWDFLRNSRKFQIGSIMNMRSEEAATGTSNKIEGGKEMPPLPQGPMGGRRSRWPFIVLDAEQKPIFGKAEKTEGMDFRPVIHNGKTVGYVGLLPPKQFLNPHQLQFLRQQKSALVLAAGGLVLAVMIFSLPLAKRLVRPIRAMTAATADLAAGKYTVRVPVGSLDELGQLARDFNTMALTLEKNEKARRQWVADISHELRTPVAVLRGELEALLDGIRTITPETIQSLHAEAMRLNRLVDDLYQLSLSDIGALTYRKENLDLAMVLRDSLESYRTEFGRKGIRVTEDISLERKTILFADRERLNQLFANVLENSLRYTDTGGELAISITYTEGQVTIEFQDSTPGVPEKELDRLFERLYRVEGSRSRTSGGAGLGLAISKDIVEAHEGTISAHPSPLGGLLIRITLPVVVRSA